MRVLGFWRGAAFGAAALALTGCAQIGDALASLGAPPQPFEATSAPAAPDYAREAAWLAFPGRNGLERSTVPGSAAVDEASAPADVFFIHPTTYQKNDVWNVAYDAEGEFDTAVLLAQASAFNGCCRIYAPRYRQASLRALDKSRPAVELAYSDVARAFAYYIAHENKGRPFIIAAHSQGSMHAVKLLQAEILGTPLQKRMVAAYVVGAYAPSTFDEIGLPICDHPRQVGCILSWNTSQTGRDGAFRLVRDKTYWWRGADKTDGQPPAICVNPLNWQQTGAAPPDADSGSLPFPAPTTTRTAMSLPVLTPRLTGARCDQGLLWVDIPRSAPRGFHDILSLLYGSYHLGDYGIFYGPLRANAIDRVEAWRSAAPRPGA